MNGNKAVADTNFILHALNGDATVEGFRHFAFSVSVVSEMELLGWKHITPSQQKAIKLFLSECNMVEL